MTTARTNPKTRRGIENAIQRHLDAAETMIAELDRLDGDADLELEEVDTEHDGREPEDYL